MRKIGIYGGSFNPVHSGHVLAMDTFVRSLDLDLLLVIPAGTPPHKNLAEGTPSGETRARLLQLAVENMPKVQVDELELQREGKNFTYDTIMELRQRYRDDQLFLLMGTDMLLSFEKWYRYADILSMVTLAVLHRYALDASEPLQDMKKRLELGGGTVVLLQDPCIDISSTTVRRMMLLGCGEKFVPQKVWNQIQCEGLYGVNSDFKNLRFEKLKEVALSLHDPKRVKHAIGCSETAAELAKIYGENVDNAARAGILHDITKALGPREQLRLCEKYDIMTDEYRGEQTKLLHGKTAAAAAEHIFGENAEVCSAVSWHTTGKANMTLLEKIIYIADYIEPNRDFDGVEKLRELAFSDIDAAVLLGIQMTIATLVQNGRSLNRHSVEARDYLLKDSEL